MRHDSTTLFLESPGAITPIPLVNGEPDFTDFTEPSLSVLQTAWQDFLDSGKPLVVIPDPELIPEPVMPEWDGFNFALFSNVDFLTYALAINNQNPLAIPVLITQYNKVAEYGTNQFKPYFDLFCQVTQVTNEHRNQWGEIAESFNLPTEFINSIKNE